MRTEYTTGYCIAAPYQISDGSLPAILTRVSGSDTLTDISLGNLQLTPDTTVAQFSLAVMQSNSLYFPGDSLLYLDALQSADPATGVPLDPADRTPLRLVAPATGFSSVDAHLARPADDAPCAFAWIHTRPTPEGLQASPQRLILHNPLFRLYNSDTALARALRSYGARPVAVSPKE